MAHKNDKQRIDAIIKAIDTGECECQWDVARKARVRKSAVNRLMKDCKKKSSARQAGIFY